MGRRKNYAVAMDVQNMLRREECAGSMGQRQRKNDAAAKAAQILLYVEECATSMGRRRTNASYAAPKDAQILQ